MNNGRMVVKAHDAGNGGVAVSAFPEVPVAMLASVNYAALATAAQYVKAGYAIAHGYQANLF